MGTSNDTSVVKLVKNYQIYALGVLLLEIALGKPLDTSIVTSNVGAELKEYLTVMRLEKHGFAARTLGPQYGESVTRCLSFKFDTTKHDLANSELQREFYHNVVCQLEGCLKIMTEPV
ncbi:hypothetical protein DM02DRAFT_619343 [Periconia macrospinosa]|uniref:DUF7580 domain-containing protein n=1 Tax=Periconia macrospinosa TaxID=97972 RepID=A0A2V1D5G5_9PLEO|nr:hypothetical protein DM02DRAFT_619343 [Periconia macrospinosa]